MILFEKYFELYEDAGPNKHLTHLEELVLTNKREGAQRALKYLSTPILILPSPKLTSYRTCLVVCNHF